MKCHCGAGTVVYSSRTNNDGVTIRRRECLNLGHRFTTHEVVVQDVSPQAKSFGISNHRFTRLLRSGVNQSIKP